MKCVCVCGGTDWLMWGQGQGGEMIVVSTGLDFHAHAAASLALLHFPLKHHPQKAGLGKTA